MLRLIGVGGGIEIFTGTHQSPDGPRAIVIELNMLVFVFANLELILECGGFDSTTDVGQGENDFAGFEGDGFFFGRRWWRIDYKARIGCDRLVGCGSRAFLDRLEAGLFSLLREVGFAGIINVGCEQSAAEGENHPGFTIVHGKS